MQIQLSLARGDTKAGAWWNTSCSVQTTIGVSTSEGALASGARCPDRQSNSTGFVRLINLITERATALSAPGILAKNFWDAILGLLSYLEQLGRVTRRHDPSHCIGNVYSLSTT